MKNQKIIPWYGLTVRETLTMHKYARCTAGIIAVLYALGVTLALARLYAVGP